MAETSILQSRAVLRFIEPGSSALCTGCTEPVKFKARTKAQQVICNVYVDGRWDRVEHYHADCYDAAGHPHGIPAAGAPTRAERRAAQATEPQSASPAA